MPSGQIVGDGLEVYPLESKQKVHDRPNLGGLTIEIDRANQGVFWLECELFERPNTVHVREGIVEFGSVEVRLDLDNCVYAFNRNDASLRRLI